MPQTRQAVKTILDNELPCVVAVTKADLLPAPEAARASISQKLFEMGLVTEENGGEVPVRYPPPPPPAPPPSLAASTLRDGTCALCVVLRAPMRVVCRAPRGFVCQMVVLSAKTGYGLDSFKEMLLLQAEVWCAAGWCALVLARLRTHTSACVLDV
jgi:hypothetical protein